MIAANKRFLKANLTQGVLGIQTNLIQLYSNNLSAVATQAALIGGFSFSVLVRHILVNTIKSQTLAYFYEVNFTMCLVTALFVLTQATVVVMFGPTMALKGASDEAVKVAAGHMMAQQYLIFGVAAVSITCLFIGAMIITWANAPYGIATITTVIYGVVYYFLLTRGKEAYFIFIPTDGGLIDLVTETDDQGNTTTTTLAERMASAQEDTRTKVKAILWKRQTIEEGGLFVKYFAVLDKGRVDFYKQEKDYRENNNPVNNRPIKLWQFDLELDPRKYSQTAMSLAGAIKGKMVGNQDFSLSDAMSSEHDLQYASKNFKFGLIPKVSSELHATFNHEFLAHDEKTYKQWTSAFSTVIKAYDRISDMPTIEQTIRVGTSDVETVVQAANIKL